MTFLTVFITDSMCLSDSFFLDDIMGSFFVFRVFFLFVSKQGKTQKMTETKHKRKKEPDEYLLERLTRFVIKVTSSFLFLSCAMTSSSPSSN